MQGRQAQVVVIRSQTSVDRAGSSMEQSQPHPRPLKEPATVAEASLADGDGGLSGLVVARKQCGDAQPDHAAPDRQGRGAVD